MTATLSILSRILAAVLGGYALAAAFATLLACTLPLARIDAVLVGLVANFLAYVLAVLWCFATRTAWKAWAGTLLPASLFAAFAWAVGSPAAS